MPERFMDLPLAVRRLLETLSDQEVANLKLAITVFGDMDADTISLIRNPRPELIRLLSELKPSEIEELENSIELVRAFRRTGRVIRWSIATLFAFFVGMVMIWDKVSPWFKASQK